ncbi:uncharacterized protein DFL_000519 [Arthrobotrys flagrans]|uniref:Uncharacterized protein n=1 Tax=Arthrobotrys flagrans TaxID=97331 RepID=A0A437AE04_ARTFL|nr:hypothetical protein DFL_000519 [Arthrobotrys flagrans]
MALARLRQEPDPRSLSPDGFIGFDWYYQVKLNGSSDFSEKRYRKLALDYIRLGHKGRQPYIIRASQSPRWINEIVPARRCAKEEGIHIIPRVSVTLYPNRERWCCQNAGNFGSETLFFRTWFGDQDYPPEQSGKLYEELISGWKDAWQVEDFVIDQQYCFTDSSYADVPTACMRSEAHTLEEWLLTRLPDQLDWMDWEEQYTEAEQYEEESLCLAIADREAIVNGWLLLSAINHKGSVIGRWRLPAGGLAAALLSLRKTILESIGEAIFNRGFGRLAEPDVLCPRIGSVFGVSDPPGLWWHALDKRSFTRERPSEKVPLDLSRF